MVKNLNWHVCKYPSRLSPGQGIEVGSTEEHLQPSDQNGA